MNTPTEVATAQSCWKDNSPQLVNAGFRSQAEEQSEGAIAHDDNHNKNAHMTSKGPRVWLEVRARGHDVVEGYPLVVEAAQRIVLDRPTLMQDSQTHAANGDDEGITQLEAVR